GDLIELGAADRLVVLKVTIQDDVDNAKVVVMRRIADMAPATTLVEGDTGRLRALYEAQKRVGSASDLNDVLLAISDASFALVPQATHVTVILRDDDDAEGPTGAAGYVPVVTRVRGQEGPASGPIP